MSHIYTHIIHVVLKIRICDSRKINRWLQLVFPAYSVMLWTAAPATHSKGDIIYCDLLDWFLLLHDQIAAFSNTTESCACMHVGLHGCATSAQKLWQVALKHRHCCAAYAQERRSVHQHRQCCATPAQDRRDLCADSGQEGLVLRAARGPGHESPGVGLSLLFIPQAGCACLQLQTRAALQSGGSDYGRGGEETGRLRRRGQPRPGTGRSPSSLFVSSLFPGCFQHLSMFNVGPA